jgi:hypothetical protein
MGRPRYHTYPLAIITLAVALVSRGGMSYRNAERAMAAYGTSGLIAANGPLAPAATTIRLWKLRVGLGKIQRPKLRARDWIWFPDHSVQAGVHKCLVVLGLRLADLPKTDWTLMPNMMEPLAVVPMAISNGPEMLRIFQRICEKTGVPRAIVADQGRDIQAGIDAFASTTGFNTVSLYDSKHCVALALKRQLSHDANWLAFAGEANRFKRWVQQTALASLAPPKQRSKARYHNVDTLVHWAETIMTPVADNIATAATHLGVSKRYLAVRVAWFERFRQHLLVWSELCMQASIYEQVLRTEGYHHRLPKVLPSLLGAPCSQAATRMQHHMADFISLNLSRLSSGERLPASTEVLESVIGAYKAMQGQHARGGFTAGALGVGVVVSENTAPVVGRTLATVRTHHIAAWAKKHIGTSVATLRRQLPGVLGNKNMTGSAS